MKHTCPNIELLMFPFGWLMAELCSVTLVTLDEQYVSNDRIMFSGHLLQIRTLKWSVPVENLSLPQAFRVCTSTACIVIQLSVFLFKCKWLQYYLCLTGFLCFIVVYIVTHSDNLRWRAGNIFNKWFAIFLKTNKHVD